MRESNRRHYQELENEQHPPTTNRTSNRSKHEVSDHTDRESNRRKPADRAHETRISNRDDEQHDLEPITLKISDGPATRRIRNANVYYVGQTVPLHCEPVGGTPAEITVTITQPDGTPAYTDVSNGAATYAIAQAGQHKYAFKASNHLGDLTAITTNIFIAEP